MNQRNTKEHKLHYSAWGFPTLCIPLAVLTVTGCTTSTDDGSQRTTKSAVQDGPSYDTTRGRFAEAIDQIDALGYLHTSGIPGGSVYDVSENGVLRDSALRTISHIIAKTRRLGKAAHALAQNKEYGGSTFDDLKWPRNAKQYQFQSAASIIEALGNAGKDEAIQAQVRQSLNVQYMKRGGWLSPTLGESFHPERAISMQEAVTLFTKVYLMALRLSSDSLAIPKDQKELKNDYRQRFRLYCDSESIEFNPHGWMDCILNPALTEHENVSLMKIGKADFRKVRNYAFELGELRVGEVQVSEDGGARATVHQVIPGLMEQAEPQKPDVAFLINASARDRIVDSKDTELSVESTRKIIAMLNDSKQWEKALDANLFFILAAETHRVVDKMLFESAPSEFEDALLVEHANANPDGATL